MCLISAELLIKRLRGDTSSLPLGEPLEQSGSPRPIAVVIEEPLEEPLVEEELEELEEEPRVEPVETTATIEVEPRSSSSKKTRVEELDEEELEELDEESSRKRSGSMTSAEPEEEAPEPEPERAIEPQPEVERVPVSARFTDLAARVRFGANRIGSAAAKATAAAVLHRRCCRGLGGVDGEVPPGACQRPCARSAPHGSLPPRPSRWTSRSRRSPNA